MSHYPLQSDARLLAHKLFKASVIAEWLAFVQFKNRVQIILLGLYDPKLKNVTLYDFSAQMVCVPI